MCSESVLGGLVSFPFAGSSMLRPLGLGAFFSFGGGPDLGLQHGGTGNDTDEISMHNILMEEGRLEAGLPLSNWALFLAMAKGSGGG